MIAPLMTMNATLYVEYVEIKLHFHKNYKLHLRNVEHVFDICCHKVLLYSSHVYIQLSHHKIFLALYFIKIMEVSIFVCFDHPNIF